MGSPCTRKIPCIAETKGRPAFLRPKMYSLPSVKNMALNTAKAQQLFAVFGSETTRLDKAGGVREGMERGERNAWDAGMGEGVWKGRGGAGMQLESETRLFAILKGCRDCIF